LSGRDVRPEEARKTVRELVTKAVERRLVSDVPLGAFLSGGIDSTIVTGIMSRLVGQPVKTFSIGFRDSPGYDETSYARIAADRFKTDHTEFIVEPGSFDLIERLVWYHDGPFGDSSAVPTYIVSRLTRQKVTVVMTGDGGDEVFAGYLRFYAALLAERIPPSLRMALHRFSRALPAGRSARSWAARGKRFADAATLPLEEQMTYWTSPFYDDAEEMLAPEIRESVNGIDRLAHFRRFAPETRHLSTLGRILLLNFNTYLRDDLLVKTDRCTMANSLEARSPFLDTALVEYVAGLPDSMKLARGRTKIVLRDAFRDLIPPEIERRGKMGFGVPFGLWMRGALREPLNELLLSNRARYPEYLSVSYVHRLLKKHQAREADLGLQLWSLLCFEVWLRSLPQWSNPEPLVAATSA
jgi:asparagine synthase (glutamine-hydrolysing)